MLPNIYSKYSLGSSLFFKYTIMDTKDSSKQPALGVIYGFFFIVSAVLLVLIPSATDTGPVEQGWWTQPALMPSIAISVMVLSAAYLFGQHIYKLRRNRELNVENRLVRNEVFEWFKPLEYFIYYCFYIWLLSIVGYFLSSLIFIITLCLRTGLRNAKWMFVALMSAFALVALFRWGLKIWVPVADLYDLFPKNIRIFLMRNF